MNITGVKTTPLVCKILKMYISKSINGLYIHDGKTISGKSYM